ncbi:MAG TPA: hypothetical protein VFN89_03380 [Solirubrobacterales bacterium]|nr:hypothetical protein [Solirubrobacterales bacterium]
MAGIDRLRMRVRLLRQSEEGMALPTALLAMMIAFSMSTAAVVFSVDTQHGSVRDHSSKEAIAAADAGANVALMRLNQFGNDFTAASPCLGLSGSTLVLSGPQADGWCPEMTGTVAEGSYAYRVGPSEAACASTGGEQCVVAVGAAGGVTRRIAVSLDSSGTPGLFKNAGIIANKDVTLTNHAEARVGIGTNGSIHRELSASICGNARHGVGQTGPVEEELSCEGEPEEANEALPPVSSLIPEDIATNNDDYRLEPCTGTDGEGNGIPTGCESDSFTKKWTSTTPWNPTTRTIAIGSSSALTLTGGDYFICKLELTSSSELIVGAEVEKLRIFFDTPEDCGLSSPAEQIRVDSGSVIKDSGYQPTEDKFAMPGLYVMGSPTITTTLSFQTKNLVNEFLLYAPNSDITLKNHGTYKGVIVGNSVTMDNHPVVEQDEGYKPENIGGATLYTRQSYVECTGLAAGTPDENC